MRSASANREQVATDGNGTPVLRAWLLGVPRLEVNGIELPDNAWLRRSARSLLFLLLASPEHRLSRALVIDRLWPEAGPTAGSSSYYQALRALRIGLEPDMTLRSPSSFIVVERNEVAISHRVRLWVDLDAFESACRVAASGTVDRRDQLRSAVNLYTGDLLADEPAAEWMTARRIGLHLAWQRAILELAELDSSAADPLATVPSLLAIVAVDPTQEEAHRALIQAFLAAGRRARAVRQFEQCRRALRDELGIEPSPATQQLVTFADKGATTANVPSTDERPLAPPQALPTPPTALVGRDAQIERLLDLMANRDVRLVTLTGPGGVGKTRLAVEVAAMQTEEFAHGAVFVALAANARPEHVLPSVAAALGLREVGPEPLAERLRRVLDDREMLLVLDNFEHVAEASPRIAALVEHCRRLTVLVTSRVPLHVQSERLFDVPPLSLPPVGTRSSFAALRRSEAVRLFTQRAGATDTAFQLTEENAAAVAAVCARLDGLPLAIELVAARIRVLSPDAMLARLDSRLDLLTGGQRDQPTRLQTMRNAIAWSNELLSDAEQALFRRLAVFAGGCTLAAADAVARDQGAQVAPALSADSRHLTSTLDGITSLVDHSLLRLSNEVDGEPRYVMLETIRVYGLEQLATSGEADVIRERHARFYLDLAERAEPEIRGPNQARWRHMLQAEQPNLRAALSWGAGQRDDFSLRLAGALAPFWWTRGNPREGRASLSAALAQVTVAPDAVRAKALVGAGTLAWALGDYRGATAFGEESLALWRMLDDRAGMTVSLRLLALEPYARGDYTRAEALWQECLALQRDLEDTWGIANSLGNLGRMAGFQGEHERAALLLAEALAVAEAAGDDYHVAGVRLGMSEVALLRKEFERAISLCHESI